MNPSFHRFISEATRLTQGGNLRAATAAIMAALRGSAVPSASRDADVMDVAARDVKRETTAAAEPIKPMRSGLSGQT